MTVSAASGIVLRDVRPGDLDAITAIYGHEVETNTASFELDPPDLAEMTRRHDTLVSGGFPYLVAEIDGALGGYAYAGPYRARPAYRFSVEDSVYVAPQARGRGLGLALLNAIIGRCGDAGFRQMVAIISTSDTSDASVALHAAAGFGHAGILRGIGYKAGAWRDTIMMQRALGPGITLPPVETGTTGL